MGGLTLIAQALKSGELSLAGSKIICRRGRDPNQGKGLAVTDFKIKGTI